MNQEILRGDMTASAEMGSAVKGIKVADLLLNDRKRENRDMGHKI